MPLMTKLREKLSLVFGIFAVLFIVYIVLDWGMDIGGRKSRGMTKGESLGVINGVEISYQEFNTQLDKYIQMFKQQYKSDPDDNQLTQLREEAWNGMVFEILVKQELQEMGFQVTDKEIQDWAINLPETLPEVIRKNFIDSTGNFNHQMYQQVRQSTQQEIVDFFRQSEELMRQTRLESKISSLVLASVKVTEGEITKKYNDDNLRADGKFISFDPNIFVDNNSVQVSDDEINSYYNSHREEYKQEEGKRLRFVYFQIVASKQDTSDVLNEMSKVSDDLKKGIDFKSLIELHSENKYDDTIYQKHGQIGTPELEKEIFEAKIGDVIGPKLDGGAYRMIKVIDSKEGKEQFVRVSHVLLKFTPSNKDSVKKNALDIFNRAKKGESFLELVKKYSEDPSAATNNGDLGYQGKGAFVKPFEDAMFGGKVGEVVGPVETSFGFHVIKIIAKDSRDLKIGDIKISVGPTGQTKDNLYNNARDFMNLAKDGDFLNEAKVSNLQVQETPFFTKNGAIPGIGYNSMINKFAFDNKVNAVSEVYKLGGSYLVFQVSELRKEGYKDLKDLKEFIKNILISKKKLQIVKSIVSDLRSKVADTDSLEKFVQLDSRLKVNSTGPFTPVSSITGIGKDDKLAAKVFSLNPNSVSKPLEGSNAYYIFYLYSKSSFDQNDYNSKRDGIQRQLLQEKQNVFFSEWRRILMEKADVVDNRDKYFR